jgi:uncharacterized membrane protein HdeD (DUF308 family)
VSIVTVASEKRDPQNVGKSAEKIKNQGPQDFLGSRGAQLESVLSRLARQPGRHLVAQSRWGQLSAGILAIIIGCALISLPGTVFLSRLIELLFRTGKPTSAPIMLVSAALCVVAVTLVDSLLHLSSFTLPPEDHRHSMIVGVMASCGIVFAILWPDITAYFATVLIAGVAVTIGVLDIFIQIRDRKELKQPALTLLSAFALVGIGIFTMIRVFVGAVIILAAAGVWLVIRGIVLIMKALRSKKADHNIESRQADRFAA